MTAPLRSGRQSDRLVRLGAGQNGRGVAVPPFLVLALAQIAIPLTDDRATIEWLSTVVVVAFGATTLALVVAAWGAGRAFGALAVVAAVTLVVERVGSTTGFPFGEYDYTGALQPTVAGVPVIVPLAWFAMGVPALEVGHAVASRSAPTPSPSLSPSGFAGRGSTGSGRSTTSERVGVGVGDGDGVGVGVRVALAVVVGALALTAWDLFLDPQMVEDGYWTWAADGAYQGIPLSNYAGWFATGVVVLGLVSMLRPDRDADVPLLALYTWWAVMSTVGFLVFFDRPFVGAVGGAAMGACAALAWARRRG